MIKPPFMHSVYSLKCNLKMGDSRIPRVAFRISEGEGGGFLVGIPKEWGVFTIGNRKVWGVLHVGFLE